MSRLSACSGLEIVKALARIGYRVARQRGSHFRLMCSGRTSVTVPNYPTISRGLLAKILRDAEVSSKEFKELL